MEPANGSGWTPKPERNFVGARPVRVVRRNTNGPPDRRHLLIMEAVNADGSRTGHTFTLHPGGLVKRYSPDQPTPKEPDHG